MKALKFSWRLTQLAVEQRKVPAGLRNDGPGQRGQQHVRDAVENPDRHHDPGPVLQAVELGQIRHQNRERAANAVKMEKL